MLAANDAHKEIGLPDDLESFFNVLLYYSLRFFRHTFTRDEVNSFIYWYFQDFSAGNERTDRMCGEKKVSTIAAGEIRFGSQYTLLQFMGPRSTRHPMNDVMKALLPWFQANCLLHLPPSRIDDSEDPEATFADDDCLGRDSDDDDLESFGWRVSAKIQDTDEGRESVDGGVAMEAEPPMHAKVQAAKTPEEIQRESEARAERAKRRRRKQQPSAVRSKRSRRSWKRTTRSWLCWTLR